MNPLAMLNLRYVAFMGTCAIAVLAVLFYIRWKDTSHEYEMYKSDVELKAAIQERKNAEMEARYESIKTEAQVEYEKHMDDLRNYYLGRMRTSARAGEMPGISKPPASVDAIPSDALPLAEQCAETTLQLIDLQKWVTDVEKVDHLVVK